MQGTFGMADAGVSPLACTADLVGDGMVVWCNVDCGFGLALRRFVLSDSVVEGDTWRVIGKSLWTAGNGVEFFSDASGLEWGSRA